MNFTREPIIETVITPKEGCKLVIKNSKDPNSEQYSVEALEIVNFGHAIFYRSLERPKSFLLPISDYEVREEKEAKMVLKNANIEKSIKIGSDQENKNQRRKKASKRAKMAENINNNASPQEEKPSQNEETQVSSSILRKLFPPPPNLIKEKLGLKNAEKVEEVISKEVLQENIEQISEAAKEENSEPEQKEPTEE